MKIVILDGYALNPGDLSWENIEKYGEVKLYDRSAAEDVGARIQHADIVLTNKAVIGREAIDLAVNLKFIGVMATGFNIVDTEAAREKNIVVSNIPAYSTASVAQLTFAFVLAFANRISDYSESVHKGDWVKSPDFSYMVKPVIELQDKTLGIIGLGQIGQAVAAIALSFGMKVIASHRHPERDKMEGVVFKSQNEVFENADFVSLHCPLNDQNKEFVDLELLKTMKPTSFLINTSRGGLVNEQDLADALNGELISGAGLDVLSSEPPSEDNPLLTAKNCLITPHIAWASKEARQRLMEILDDNISAFLKGEPLNVVN